MSSEEHQEIQVIGPGQILKSARLAANLSIKDIAQKIHLKSITIEDIEADIIDNNISLTFIKGYIKLYAKQVLVPESEVMNAFERIHTQKKEPAKLQSFSRRVAHQANDDKLMLMTYFILAVVIALVVIWWFQQGENENNASIPDLSETNLVQNSVEENVNNNTEETAEENVVGILNQVTEVAGIEAQTTTQASQSISEGAITAVESEAQQVIQEPESEVLDNSLNILADLVTQESPELALQPAQLENERAQVADTVELVFTFSDDCWMNLSDATGENIAYGVKASGRVMTVSGQPPFIVTLGAPQAVQISYANDAVDMSNFKRGNTAKFTLPFVD